MFTVEHGRLLRDGQPFFSVGFNYHPSPSGCQYWRAWDAERIDTDLRMMAERGFNTIRFFLFWADFEPSAGCYDEQCMQHLHTLVASAGRHGLVCIPALLTIWMNGQLFDLPWRANRNPWTDPIMVEREIEYIHRIATVLADADNILAYDLGDELIHVDFTAAQALSRVAVADWQRALADAIRAADPGALVLQGNEASAVVGFHSFRPDNSQALDLLAIHGFPVWSPFAIESIASYKASCYPSFLVRFARTYGTVLVDEIGCYGGDEAVAHDYLRAALHSVLASGASGTIVWCWQDFASSAKPYMLRPGERFVGLLDVAGRAKPAMAAFEAFARRAVQTLAGVQPLAAPIGVYIPDQYNIPDGTYLHAGNSSAPAAFYAHVLLTRAHLPFEFTRGPLERYRLVICPSVQQITIAEQERLAAYVAQGGVVYYSSGEYLHGFGGEELFGVRLHDFTLQPAQQASFTWQGQTYDLIWGHDTALQPHIARIVPTTAEVLATYPNGAPALTRQHYGAGTAYYLNAPFEWQLNLPYRLELAPWHMLYTHLAQSAGIQPDLDCDQPEVEVALLRDARCWYGLIINHAPYPLQATVTRYFGAGVPGLAERIALDAKDARILMWDAEA